MEVDVGVPVPSLAQDMRFFCQQPEITLHCASKPYEAPWNQQLKSIPALAQSFNQAAQSFN